MDQPFEMKEVNDAQEETARSFTERVTEEQVGPCRLIMLETPVDSVVSWRGSFRSQPNFAEGEGLVQDLMVSLLDKGTAHRDRFEIAEILEDRGAQLSFSGDSFRVRCRGRALTHDVPDVLTVMAEQLREPSFEEEEVRKALQQRAGTLQRALESTAKQAAGGLSRCLYGENHPNYIPKPQSQLQQLQSLSGEDVRTFHEQHVGAGNFILVVVGDLDEQAIREAVREHFIDWDEPEGASSFGAEGLQQTRGQSVDIPLPDKDSIDVRLGHTLPVRRDHNDYLPLYVASYILGGNFSARLMASIRDDMGLTYGIGSRLTGVSTEHDGHWRIGLSLSREKLKHGLAETRKQVQRFVEEGATADELDEKKTTIMGSFKVGLATTGGLAESLLRAAQRGFGVSYLDRFPDLIREISLGQLNSTLQHHLDPERLQVARAGHLSQAEPTLG